MRMREAGDVLRGRTFRLSLFVVFATASLGLRCWSLGAQPAILPTVQATALDGHTVSLPRDLSPTTVMIVGFSRGSADATTAWEIQVRKRLTNSTAGFYDVAVLASVPGFLHVWVTRSIRGKVPPVLQPRFLAVFTDEAGWKRACGYDPKAPDAPYVVLVDRSGQVLWRTHEGYSEPGFDRLAIHARNAATLNAP